MQEIKVSVIMPCHNGEDYIGKTVESLLAQSLKEIEVICVDDESKDSTFDILKDYEKKDSRVKAYNQKKANAGAARNLGRKKASGEYLIFLDSDDLFEPDMLEKMYEACVKDQADLCICNADQYYEGSGEYIDRPLYLAEKFLPDKTPFSKEEVGKYILHFTRSVPWNKMVKESFLKENGICFQEIERANDQFYSIMCLLLAERITVVKDKLVHYKVKQQGNLTTTFSKSPLCPYDAMSAVKEELEKRKLLELSYIRCAFDNKILNLLTYTLNIQSELTGFRRLYDKMKEEGFKQLGVEVQDEEYYFNEAEYQNLQRILQYSCEEYLVIKHNEYYEKVKQKNNVIREKNKQIKELKDEKKVLQQKEKELQSIKSRKWYRLMTKLSRKKVLVKDEIK